MGGTYTIGVCGKCNADRGANLSYSPFLQWVEIHTQEFQEAIRTSNNTQENKDQIMKDIEKAHVKK